MESFICPAVCVCGQRLDAATSLDDHAPAPGAITFCVYCGKMLVFTAEMKLVALAKLPPCSEADRRRLTLIRARILALIWHRRRGIELVDERNYQQEEVNGDQAKPG